jgi:membrane protease YdiL (CAAX protease family)
LAFIQRHPVTAFVVTVLAIGWPLLAVPPIVGLPTGPFLIVLTLVVLLGTALFITRLADRPGAIRLLLSRILIWRFSPWRWALILFGVPVLTVAIAAVSGTFQQPDSGWGAAMRSYLFDTLVIGALMINLWEETAWSGFVQSRLMSRHGLLGGSLVTAVFFAGIHVPLQFQTGWTWSDAAAGLGVLFGASPFYRYLLGMHLLDTRGSILAVAVQHASWNAAGKIDGVSGWWQPVAAMVLLTVLIAIGRRLWRAESRPMGLDEERTSAAEWTAVSSPLAAS